MSDVDRNESNLDKNHHVHDMKEKKYKIEEILNKFKLSTEHLCQVMALLSIEIERGLEPTTHANADIKMFPTYVRTVPDGTEVGDVLALDLGGTNFRVLLISLANGNISRVESNALVIPPSIMVGTGMQLFDHIAKCLAEFVHAIRPQSVIANTCFPLGFTFSFACVQQGLASALLVSWAKGFDCSDVVGKDVVELLQNAIDKRSDVNIKVMALVNDTVGTLVACAHTDRNTKIGLVLGTGSNACYVEHIDAVKTWTRRDMNEPKQMIINMEWGEFGNNGCLDFLRTQYDYQVDKLFDNPNRETVFLPQDSYEKLMAGMYMGEIVRLIIVDLWQNDLLFVNHREQTRLSGHQHALYTKGCLNTKFVSEIETDSGVTFRNTKNVLQQLGINKPTYDDCAVVKHICTLVSKRAAQLAAAGLAVLVNRIDESNVTIAVDGSLYRFHPNFKNNMENTMKQVVHQHIKVWQQYISKFSNM